MRVLNDAFRLAFGTLTVIRVPAPREVDARRAGWAMAIAPTVGGVLSAVCLALFAIVDAGANPLVTGLLTVGLLALLTRGMHLDGLADVADGLGAAKSGVPDPERGLAVMRRGDVGPFGVVTLVVVLGLQAATIAQLADRSAALVVLALVVSRFILPVLCMRGIPAARTEGLGPMVAGAVDWLKLVTAAAITAGAVAALWALANLDHAQQFADTGTTLAVIGSGVAVGTFFALHCIQRFGGITGDVLGACVELTFTAALVAAALLV